MQIFITEQGLYNPASHLHVRMVKESLTRWSANDTLKKYP